MQSLSWRQFATVSLLFLLGVASCKLFGGGALLETPKIEWVRADRATFDAIGEKFRTYVVADPSFADDPEARAIWIAALEDWKARLESVERVVLPTEEGGGD